MFLWSNLRLIAIKAGAKLCPIPVIMKLCRNVLRLWRMHSGFSIHILCNLPRSLPRKKAELVMIISLAASVRNRAGGAALVRAVEQDFVGGAPERRPWANKREDRPNGAPNSPPPQPGFDRDARREPGKQLENGTGEYRGALHSDPVQQMQGTGVRCAWQCSDHLIG